MYFVLVVLDEQYVDGGVFSQIFQCEYFERTQNEGSARVEKNSFFIKQENRLKLECC